MACELCDVPGLIVQCKVSAKIQPSMACEADAAEMLAATLLVSAKIQPSMACEQVLPTAG